MREDIVYSVVDALARTESTQSHDLTYSLHDYIDTDALAALNRHHSDEWSLSFSVPSHDVRVTGRGEIFVDGDRVDPVTSVSH